MNLVRLCTLAAMAWAACAATAPSQHGPYAGLETRAVKALSDQQIADLRAGRGMGLAFAAELNGYPGPLHLLEVADSLMLSDSLRTTVQELYGAMKAEAVPLGERLIEQETALDRAFVDHTITEASLVTSTQAIGATQGALRAAHLKYHLAAFALLTSEQVRRYGELRGYGSGAPDRHPDGGHRTPH